MIVNLPLSQQQAQKIIRDSVAGFNRVIFTHHAEERMIERDISATDVFRVLSNGKVIKEPKFDKLNNTWKVAVEGISAGSVITVAVAIEYYSQPQPMEDDCDSIILTVYG